MTRLQVRRQQFQEVSQRHLWGSRGGQKEGPQRSANRAGQRKLTMETNTSPTVKSQLPLRAIVEIIGGELNIYPVTGTDAEEKRILDALRFVIQEHV